MKKIVIIIFIAAYTSCNNTPGNSAEEKAKDSIGLTNPSVIDTTKHPTGMDNSSVITTDTAAIDVSNSIKKLDSVKKARGK